MYIYIECCIFRWHRQLSDKGAAVKSHVYWAMLNCNGDENALRSALDSIVPHYMGQHHLCHADSRCRRPGPYASSHTAITDIVAQHLLEEKIRALFIYKNPKLYVSCMNTHYVESFNNTVLIYMDKRVHYHECMYKIRLGLAILDWNEHVDRPASSIGYRPRPGNPQHPQSYRVLTRKTNAFASDLWEEFVRQLEHVADMDAVEGPMEEVQDQNHDSDGEDD